MNYIHAELLLGKRVRDVEGRVVGRILSIHGTIDGPRCHIREFRLGTAALLDRLGFSTARLLGLPTRRKPKHVPWQLMDLSDPEHPRLTVRDRDLPARAQSD